MESLNLAPLKRIEDALEDLGKERQVALYLEDLLNEVAGKHEQQELVKLNRECIAWNSKAANTEADFMVLEPTLFNSTLRANVDAKRCIKENKRIEKELEKLKIQLSSLREEEDRLLSREDQKKAKKDVSVLPMHVLRQVIDFLKCKEFIQTMLVCRRWRYYLDQAYLWKVFMVRQEKLILKSTKIRKQKLEQSIVPPPEEFRIECKQIRRGLQKAEIFQECLRAQEEEMNELKSGKEDIEGKIRANANTHKFLEDELQSLNHKLGLKRIEINEWQKKAHDSALENKELAKKMHDIDMKLNEELQNKQHIMETTTRTLAKINTKISVLEEIHSEIGKGKDKGAQISTLTDLLQKKKAQKKLLKNTVKALHEQLERLVKETTKLRKIELIAGQPMPQALPDGKRRNTVPASRTKSGPTM
eukprot:CAMPEP_0197518320 /NCGR_PEP_ID=MMETSP1318-20131121/3487_1 /TAXON_ID=552666 /ORGANISM="Partenskyella glossopodia, Strain RCC365" /LENGTH=417 /DNA_ID=CAMNT_0043068563 /DNA_START=14 /DNA_END=1267 /DNA_ORIENTATION=+